MLLMHAVCPESILIQSILKSLEKLNMMSQFSLHMHDVCSETILLPCTISKSYGKLNARTNLVG